MGTRIAGEMTQPAFADRDEAGTALAQRVLWHLSTRGVEHRPLVLALTRGGLPVAAHVARWTAGDLDLLADPPAGGDGIAGRVVVAVDDGLTTGRRARTALDWLTGQCPRRLVLAVPVCPRPARDLLYGAADALIVLRTPPEVAAVDRWYAKVRPLDDADVARLLSGR